MQLCIIQMLPQIWQKTIPTIIDLSQQDIADQCIPLPLITKLPYNWYIGFCTNLAKQFYAMYAPYPLQSENGWFSLKQTGEILADEDIVYHIIDRHKLSVSQPLRLTYHFRSLSAIKIDLQKHYKNNLKASTAIKHGKMGTKVLTLEMTVQNVDNMFERFCQNSYTQFLASDDPMSDDLGYLYLNAKAEKIAIKFLVQESTIQRSCDKQITLSDLLLETFGENFCRQAKPRLYLVQIPNLEIKMEVLEKYSHPDGYLYINI